MADEKPVVDEEQDPLKDPDEDTTPEEETPEEDGDDEEAEKAKSRRSEIAQKKHWREKAQKASSKIKTLEEELESLKKARKVPDDEKERAAQEYIRKQILDVNAELQKQKQLEEAKETNDFEEEVESVLEDNPDMLEEELLNAVEEFEVSPKVAAKILKKQSKAPAEKKPKMPQARRASPERAGNKPDDSKKTIWQIAQDEIERVKSK